MPASASAATRRPRAYHWVNVMVGLLDSTFLLTDVEQIGAADVLGRLLERLRIDDRPAPTSIPAALALEIDANFYTIALTKARTVAAARPVRMAGPQDPRVSVEAWSNTFVSLLTQAYPSIEPIEAMLASKVIGDLLLALGVPDRAALHTPDDVMRSYHAIDVAA